MKEDTLQKRGPVLVVDDNDTNRLVLQRMLGKRGWEVDVALDGAQALEMCSERVYQIVFMDLRMPVMDGFEATEGIRRRERESGRDPAPIVALSAHVPELDQRVLRHAGFTCTLPKPISRDQLLELMAQYVAVGDEDEMGSEFGDVLDENARRQHNAESGSVAVRVDPEFRDIAPWIVGKLKERLREAAGLLNTEDWDALRMLGHDIRGEGGTIGLTELEELGKRLRDAAALGDRELVHAATQTILRYLEHVVFV